MHEPPFPNLTRRHALWIGGALACAAAGCRTGIEHVTTNAPQLLHLLAESRLKHRLSFEGSTVGGLSGIDYDQRRGEYLLLSDDRSDLAPVRFYQMQWSPIARQDPPRPMGVTYLRRANGEPWPSRRNAAPEVAVPDPEAIRWRADTDTLLWTSEGDLQRGFGQALYESRRDGSLVRQIPLPAMFDAASDGHRGARDNLGLEGLALTPDGRHAWLAMEAALLQDGPLPSFTAPGGPCRFTQIELSTGKAIRQIAYVPDPIPRRPLLPGTYADNGVSEVLMIDADRMLVLERSYAVGAGNSLRLYEIDTRGGSDVLAVDALAPDNHKPAQKTLVADFATLGLSQLDNTEGLCWGPDLPNGHRMLVAVSDDNFNPLQITQFAAFEFTG